MLLNGFLLLSMLKLQKNKKTKSCSWLVQRRLEEYLGAYIKQIGLFSIRFCICVGWVSVCLLRTTSNLLCFGLRSGLFCFFASV